MSAGNIAVTDIGRHSGRTRTRHLSHRNARQRTRLKEMYIMDVAGDDHATIQSDCGGIASRKHGGRKSRERNGGHERCNWASTRSHLQASRVAPQAERLEPATK